MEALAPIPHTTTSPGLVAAGVDGSGDFPAVAYADSFVYVTVVAGVAFDADEVSGLKEQQQPLESLVDFAWLTTNEDQRQAAVLEAFGRLAGIPVEDAIAGSDYRQLKTGGSSLTVQATIDGFIIPPAHDAGNHGIQFRATGELGMASLDFRRRPRLTGSRRPPHAAR